MLSLIALATALSAPDAAAPDVPDVQSGEVVVTGQRSEGKDDYTTRAQTTATRLPLSQRETPQSISVVTRAQIDDFQLSDVNTVLTTVPGVSVFAAETDRVYYSARGFDIQTLQVDGVGLPFAFGIQTGSLDTATFDRIEVVRGAPGLLSSTGNPSAVINFIRKRPTRTLRGAASAQYGSFDNLRLDGDLSVPLTASGAVRARAVGAYLDTESYLDRYRLRRWTGYGIVEADLGSRTVLSAGYAHQDHQSRGAMWGAIPLYYTDGTRIPLDRSANSGQQWSGWNVIERQIFGDVTHDFGGGWTGKVSVLRRANDEHDELFYVFGAPDRTTGQGIVTYPGAFLGKTRNLSIDAYVSGKVNVGGRAHDVMFGVNRGAEKYLQSSAYDPAALLLPITVDQMLAGNVPRPNYPAFTPSLDIHTRRETAYGLVRLNLADPLKLMIGGNYTSYSSEGASYGSPTNFDSKRFLPFVGATFDLSSTISAYASYATIFRPQTEFDANNRLLDPVKGDNLEAGLKGEWAGGRFNASAAVFQARQRNTAEAAGFDATLGRTIYRGVDATSQGIELELSGRPAEGLQVTGGYTAMRVRGENDEPVRTFVPRNLARLNVTWSPAALPALKLGASAQYQSRFYFEPGTSSTTTGQPIRLTQKGYALLDLLARYDLTDRIAVSMNLRNVTNAKYLTSLTFDQGYYGAPRAILGTIGFKY